LSTSPFHRAFYLTGPTAVGKTAVGVALARLLDAEILALDSMTVYRGMDIGTAKPTLPERGGVPHHLIDRLDPWDSASVADFRDWALEVLFDLEARGRRALFVGGTALYLKAMLRGLFEGPGADLALRTSLEEEADRLGDQAMHDRLAALDPPTANRLHPNDRRRLIRALEVIAMTGRTLSEQQLEHGHPAPASVPVFALERPRPELFERINHRVEAMFAEGLIEEVERLRSGPRPMSLVASKAVGYGEVIEYLEGRINRAEALALTQMRTRQFAKRQATWFRNLAEVKAWPVATNEPPETTAERLAEQISIRDRID
jgi:tRNA dimethylallyltransferase